MPHPLADLDAGTATRLAADIATELAAWLDNEGIAHQIAHVGRVATIRAVGYLPGTRAATLAARLGALLPQDHSLGIATVRFAVPPEQVAPLRGHACRRVEGRAIVDGVPVVVTLEAAGLRVQVVATVTALA